MSQHVQFTMSGELALAMHVPLLPRMVERAEINTSAFSYLVTNDNVFHIDCTRELAAGFIEGLRKMTEQDHPAELKAQCWTVIARILELLQEQRNASMN